MSVDNSSIKDTNNDNENYPLIYSINSRININNFKIENIKNYIYK
jgi:hypothetical protein